MANELAVMLAFLIVATAEVVAQSGGRGARNVRCPNGGYINGKFYCNLSNAPPAVGRFIIIARKIK